MKPWLILILAWPLAAGGELVWLPDAAPQQVFAGEAQPVKAVIRNRSDQRVAEPIYARLYQVSSATMAPLGKSWFWKRLELLPQQTVLEEIRVSFPRVRIGSSFRLFWLDERGTTLAHTDVWAYPNDLLQPLTSLAGGSPVGVFDPDRRLAPVLREQQIEFVELGDALAEFKGRLLIIGPVARAARAPETFAQKLGRHAKERGLALVWFQPPDERQLAGVPVAYCVHLGRGTVVVSPTVAVADLAASPGSQLNLVWLAELAVRRTPLEWLETATAIHPTP